MLSTTTDLPQDRLWTRNECRLFCGMTVSTFYKRYPQMIREEGAPLPCTGRGRGARWNPHDWFNWAARQNKPVITQTAPNLAWTDEMRLLLNGSNY